MGVLYAVRYAHSASRSLCAQSFPSGRIVFLRIVLTSQLLTSTCPFAWGSYGVVMRWCTSYFFNNARKWELLKCEPPSLMMALRQPYRAKMHRVMKRKTSRWSFVLVGIASTHLDTLSTATNMYSFPSEGGKGPMKSIPQRSKISTSRIGRIGISSRLEMLIAA